MSRTLNILVISMLMNKRDTEVLTESVTARVHKEYEIFWDSVISIVDTDIDKKMLIDVKSDSFNSTRYGVNGTNTAGVTYSITKDRLPKVHDIDLLYDYMEDSVFGEILRLYSLRIVRYELIMMIMMVVNAIGFLMAGISLIWLLALLPVYVFLGLVFATLSIRSSRFFFNTGVRFRSHVEMLTSYTIPDLYFSKSGLLPILKAPINDTDDSVAPVEINILPVHKIVLTFLDLLDAKTLNLVMKDDEHKELDKTMILSRLISKEYAVPLKARLIGE